MVRLYFVLILLCSGCRPFCLVENFGVKFDQLELSSDQIQTRNGSIKLQALKRSQSKNAQNKTSTVLSLNCNVALINGYTVIIDTANISFRIDGIRMIPEVAVIKKKNGADELDYKFEWRLPLKSKVKIEGYIDFQYMQIDPVSPDSTKHMVSVRVFE